MNTRIKTVLQVLLTSVLLLLSAHLAVSQAASNPSGYTAGRCDSSSDQEATAQVNLADLDITQLANVQVVTSASKKAECLSGAPAAIFVLTGADMQRGGFATLPEALRTVPGLYVSETDSHIWQISARGFSDLANNKMLVLVDGRSVYSPDEGTVYWDVLDIPIAGGVGTESAVRWALGNQGDRIQEPGRRDTAIGRVPDTVALHARGQEGQLALNAMAAPGTNRFSRNCGSAQS